MSDSKDANTSQAHHPRKERYKIWWLWSKRLLTLCFFIGVPALLFMLVKNLDWQEVKSSLQAYKTTTLLLGALIAIVSFCTISTYELLAKKYVGHKIPANQVLPLGFVCYAFNLNLAWVGGMALRFRLYTRSGLSIATITQITTFTIVTNWLGYIILAGIIFSFRLINMPEGWKIGTTGLQFVGFALLAIAAAYFCACAFLKQRSWTIRGYEINVPSFRMALVQASVAAFNWCLMGLLIYTLLPDKASYPMVLGILLISSMAGVITHIPAGLGVIEAVFIAMMQHEIAKSSIVAALLGYRALYFLMPLAIAVVIYLILERRAKKAGKEAKKEARLSAQ